MNSSTTNTTVYNVTTWPNAAAALIMTLSSAVGLYVNGYTVRNFIKDKHQKTSFNLICTFRAVNNILILAVAMIGVFVPAAVTGYSFYPPIVESVLIVSTVNLMVFNEFQGIYLSLNRLFAIYAPIKYNMLFGIKSTVFLHVLYYLNRVWNVAWETKDRYEASNYMLFSTEHLAYGGIIVAPDGMFIWAICLILAPLAVNVFTFGRLYYLRKRTSRESEHWQRAKRNMIQFAQTFFQDSLFSISVICSLKLNTLSDNRFYTFLTQTFSWQCVHVLDGLVMVISNERLALLKRSFTTRISPLATAGKPAENSGKATSTALPIIS